MEIQIKEFLLPPHCFDKGAEEKAKNAHHKIILIDGSRFIKLMNEFNVGVQIKSTFEVKQLDKVCCLKNKKIRKFRLHPKV